MHSKCGFPGRENREVSRVGQRQFRTGVTHRHTAVPMLDVGHKNWKQIEHTQGFFSNVWEVFVFAAPDAP
jgi:hypothetical protein